MKEYKQIGAYGLVIKNNQILLIKKFGGPYDYHLFDADSIAFEWKYKKTF